VSAVDAVLTAEQFRDVIGHFATGVTVITTWEDGEPCGTTANAVTSLCVEPPMLLVCMNEQSATGRAIAASGAFGVSILAEGQDALARRFATKAPDKFTGVDIATGPAGQPLLADALAHLECRVSERVRAGTHTVFLANVERATTAAGAPLAYFRGRFGRLELSPAE
jgi:flavin reductase (DIM6/NTAB) family NADH-FMN oxidoreductase RutF